MSDDTTEDQTTEPAAADAAEPAAPQEGADPWADPDKARKEIEKLRRENAANRTKAKDRDQLATKVAEFERAQLTEQERAAAELTEAQQRAAQLSQRVVRAEVKALASDLFADPEDAAAFLDLGGYTDDSGDVDTDRIKADLAALLERKPHLGKPETSRRPAPDRLQGSSGNGRAPSDPAAEFAGFLKQALNRGR